MIELGKKLTVIIPPSKGHISTHELINAINHTQTTMIMYYDCDDSNYHPRDIPERIQYLIKKHIHEQKQQLVLFTMSPYVLTTISLLILAYDIRDRQKLYPDEILLNYYDVKAYDNADGNYIDLMDKEFRGIDTKLDQTDNIMWTQYNTLLLTT